MKNLSNKINRSLKTENGVIAIKESNKREGFKGDVKWKRFFTKKILTALRL